MQYAVETSYNVTGSVLVTLPNNASWDDVEGYGVKWNTIYITMKDGTELEFELDPITSDDDGEFKRPSNVDVYAVNKNGNTDYNKNYA